jgi:hypothetical protein
LKFSVGRVVFALVVAVMLLAGLGVAPGVAGAQGCPETSPSYDGPCGPLFTTPQWSDHSGWSSPSEYETIQLARLGAESRQDLIGRDSVGLWVERFDTATGQWRLLGSADGGVALPMPASEGWDRPSQYATIQTADLDGDGQYELLARAADGVHVYRWHPGTGMFTDISHAPRLLSDAAGGNHASVYETIQTADLLGDGHAELVARTPHGIEYARWNQHTGHFEHVTQTGIAPDAHGGNIPSLYKTIQTGDLNGDGKADLMLLAGGLRLYVRESDGRFHEQKILPLTPQGGYGRPSQYETVRAVHFPGVDRDLVMARDSSGLHSYEFHRGDWLSEPIGSGPLRDLSDADGFNSPSQYRTIRTGDITGAGAFNVVARTRTGIEMWGLVRLFGVYLWAKLSDGPALTGPVWDQASHYDTIGVGDISGHGRAALIARGVFGVRTFSWHGGAFGRPHRYGEFPAFAGHAEANAYAEVSRLLLGHGGDFRKLTYASPNHGITEGELNDYRSRLAERCTPLAAKRKPAAKHKPAAKRKVGGPPRYTDCKPPAGSGVNQAAWTAVSNQIIAELWAASGVVAHFTILEGIETKLFQDKQGTLPALDAELALPPNPPDRSPTFLKLTKGSLDILKGLVEFFPVAGKFPRILRTVALTGNALGAIADGLSLSSSPSPPAPYGQIVGEVAKLQQLEGDITQAQRRYVLADYGLSMAVGGEVKGRLLTLDQTAALSAGRQAFAIWVTQLYLPAYWRRYLVTGCRNDVGLKCDVPTGSFVRVTGQNQFGTNFEAVLVGGSTCVLRTIGGFTRVTCTWGSPAGATYDRVVTPVPKECRYDPTPGSIAAWRYGCPYGVPASELIDGTNGWNLPLTSCAAHQGRCTNALRAKRPRRGHLRSMYRP